LKTRALRFAVLKLLARFERGQIQKICRLRIGSSARRVPLEKSKFLFKRRAFLRLWVFNLPERIRKWSDERATGGLIVRPPKLRKTWKTFYEKGLWQNERVTKVV